MEVDDREASVSSEVVARLRTRCKHPWLLHAIRNFALQRIAESRADYTV